MPLAHPEFIRKNKIRRAEQLFYTPLIQSNVNVVQWTKWFNEYTNLRTPERFSLRFDRSQMSLDAASQGLGVALESNVIANQHLKAGVLVPVFDSEKSISASAHTVVYPARNSMRPSVQAFLKWIHGQAKKSNDSED
jgi:DNA-binding transcriptional LysR family regulator